MKAIIIVDRADKGLVVKLGSEDLIRKVRALAGCGRYSDAMVSALAGGSFAGEVGPREIRSTDADVIISRSGAHWTLL